MSCFLEINLVRPHRTHEGHSKDMYGWRVFNMPHVFVLYLVWWYSDQTRALTYMRECVVSQDSHSLGYARCQIRHIGTTTCLTETLSRSRLAWPLQSLLTWWCKESGPVFTMHKFSWPRRSVKLHPKHPDVELDEAWAWACCNPAFSSHSQTLVDT